MSNCSAAFLVSAVLGPIMLAAPQTPYSVREEPACGSGCPQVAVIRDNAAGIEAAVAPSEGGELTSLRVRFKGEWVELVYRAREYGSQPGFRGKASILWPAVGGQYPVGSNPAGSCVEGTYPVGDRTYPMPCHGFAMSLPWRLAGHSADKAGGRISVELRDSEKTRANYPFGFLVRVTYEISGGRLKIFNRVSADKSNSGPMPFSMGNHMSFRLPFLKGTDPGEMKFESPNSFELLRDSRGLLNGERRARSFAATTRLKDFDASVALPLAGYVGVPYALLADPGGLALRITQRASSELPEPLVRFNIYGGPKQGFFCPEPWFGLQNSLNLKKGMVTLEPGADWEWIVEIQPETAIQRGAR